MLKLADSKRIYRNVEGNIGIEFSYEDEHDLRSILEGLTFELLSFAGDYNLTDECIERLQNPNYWIGSDLKVQYVDDDGVDEFLGEDWYLHLGN